MNGKQVKKFRQIVRKHRKGYSVELMREFAKQSRFERLKFCIAIMKMKRVKPTS